MIPRASMLIVDACWLAPRLPLTVNPRHVALFHAASPASATSSSSTPSTGDPYTSLVRLLQRQDWLTQEHAVKLLAKVIAGRPKASSTPGNSLGATVEPAVTAALEWSLHQLRYPSSSTSSYPTIVRVLSTLLAERAIRPTFIRLGGVPLLMPLLVVTQPPSIQLLYEATLCVWYLTFAPEAVAQMENSRAVSGLVEVARSMVKEKVVRTALLALRNLLGYDAFGPEMVECGLQKVLAALRHQAFTDEELLEAAEALEEGLAKSVQVLSSFDKYRAEALSGHMVRPNRGIITRCLRSHPARTGPPRPTCGI